MMYEVELKKDITTRDRWYSSHKGEKLVADKYDPIMGYRVAAPTETDVEFYIPMDIIVGIKAIPDYLVLGIEQLDPLCVPERKGNWVDLKVAEEVVMSKDAFKYILLGIKVDIPRGYEAHIIPRSSTFKRWGLIQTNSMGLIDTEFSEEWVLPAMATKDVMIPKGTAIAQFRLVKSMVGVRIVPVNMKDTGKTRSGLGSTDEAKLSEV